MLQRIAVLLAFSWTSSLPTLYAEDAIARLAPGEELRKKLGSTQLQITHRKPSGAMRQQALVAELIFDRDILFAGNHLAAGSYQVVLLEPDTGQVHVVFQSENEESLRYAVRPGSSTNVSKSNIVLQMEEPHQRRGRRRERQLSGEIQFHWEGKSAALAMDLPHTMWRSTPAPELPDELLPPWEVVESSLLGFVNQSMDQHVEHFADNFESDWDDGGSQEAHMQMIGRMLYEGEFEDSVLKLDGMEWERDEGRIVFRGLVVQAPFGSSPLAYTVEHGDDGWKVVHLDGPKQ